MFKYTPSLLNLWIHASIKNSRFLNFLIFAEFFSILVECLNPFARLLRFFDGIKMIDADDLKLFKLNVINPVHYLQKLTITKNLRISECQAENCSFSNSIVLIISSLITLLLMIHHYMAFYNQKHKSTTSSKEGDKSSSSSHLLNFILVNLIDILLKNFSIFIFYLLFNKILVSFYFNSDLIYAIISLVFLIFFSFLSYFHVNYILLFIKLDIYDSLHYDNFSKNYDLLLLIIKILIGLNKNLILINNGDATIIKIIIALDYLLICLLFNYLTTNLLKIINDKNLNLVTNYNLNLLRFFNILFVCVFILLNIFFQIISIFEIILIIFGTLLVSISILLLLNKTMNNLFYNEEKLLYQLTYLIDLFLRGEDGNKEFEMISIKIKCLHSLNCNNTQKCNLCKLEDLRVTQEINDPNKINLISCLIKSIEDDTSKSFSNEEFNYFNFIKLVFEYNITLIDTSVSPFKIIYKTKEFIQQNSNNINNFYNNLVILYTKINHQKLEDSKKFKIICNYDSSLLYLKQSLEIIKDIVDTLDSRVKKDLYPQTSKLNYMKLQIMKNLEENHLDKNFHNDNFSFLMTKFIFERTFNIDVNSSSKKLLGSEDFDFRQDLMQDHFIKDKILLIKYNVTENTLIISRASKELSNFQGKYLEEIFPKSYQELGKQRFINDIHSNKESFLFEFLSETSILNPLNFVENIKLNCKIFRSPDLQEIFILSNFDIPQEEILVFETKNNNEENKEQISEIYDNISKSHLVTFSSHLDKTLLLDPTLLKALLYSKVNKKYLLFNDIFRKITLASQQNKNIACESSELDFVINYKLYYNNFFSDIEKNLHSIDNEHIIKYLEEAKYLRESSSIVNCRLNFKFCININDSSILFVFSFKNFSYRINPKFGRGLHDNIIKEGIDENKQFNGEDSSDNLLNNLENYQKGTSSGASISSASGSGGALRDSILSTISMNGNKSSLISSDKKMANFTFTTLFINFCLALYCVFFLFMGFSSNNKMKQLNLLKTNFNTFERMFYQTALSQFYNVGVYKEGTTYMDDYLFGGYWDQFLGTGLTINMGDYANSELFVKADFLKQNLITIQNFIYDSIYKDELDPIFYFNTDYKVLYTGEDNELKLQTRNPNFFETILMFMNNAKASVFYTTNTMIYIHNYDLHTGKYDLSSFFNKNVTNVQKAVYEAIFNFPVYLNNFNKILLRLEELYYSQVDYIFNLNLYLSLILIGLHIFLLIVSISIISFLKKTIGESNYIYAKVVTGDWTRYLTMKVFTLKEMINFYKIDPCKSSSKLRKDLKDTSKIVKENQIKEEKMYNLKDNYNQNRSEEAQIVIGNLISPLINVLIYLFSFYLIYAYSFIIIFNTSKSDIIITSKYSSEYLQVEKGIMNSILLLQCILFSNQTDYSLNQYLKNYVNFPFDPNYENGYIWDLIEQAKISRNYITSLEQNYAKFGEIANAANEIAWCDNLYSQIQDDVFSITKKSFAGNSLLENLKIVCKHYPVMGESYYTNAIEEIYYIAAKMTRNYLHSYSDYMKMKKTNDETEFFDEFTIAVIIIRPIQTYLLNNNIASLTKSTEDNFVLIVIVFMVGNLLVECLIFIVINKKLIRRVLVINEEITCLTLCLTA